MPSTPWTPGLWRVGGAGATVFGSPTGAPAPEAVARLAPTPRHMANARLIAAAPELADTLGQIVDAFDESGRTNEEVIERLMPIIEQARALLARLYGDGSAA